MDSLQIDNPKKWGLSLAGLNIFFIVVAMGTMMRKLGALRPEESTMPYWLWIVGYILHIMLNVYLFLCLRKRDRVAILVWLSPTILLFVFRAVRHETYGFVELIINVYLLIAIILLTAIYFKMSSNKRIIRVVQPVVAAVTPDTQANQTAITIEAGSKN